MPIAPTGRQGLTTAPLAGVAKNLGTRGVLANDALLADSEAVGREARMQVYPLANGAGQDIVIYVGFDSATGPGNYVFAYRPGDIWIERADDSPRHSVDLRRWYYNANTNDCGFTWGID